MPLNFWPRFNDKAINDIKFDKPKGTTENFFIDPEICILPKHYQNRIYRWARPIDLFEGSKSAEITIASDSDLNLYQTNEYLTESSYYIHLIDSFEILQKYKFWNKDDFSEFGFKEWKPTNHIYSGEKYVARQPHKCKLNNYGKYAVRLFHCGGWRLVIVDDRIPVTRKNEILMPSIFTPLQKLDLWPILLCKAILKLNFCPMESSDFYIDQTHTPQCKMFDDGLTCNCKKYIPVNPKYLLDESELERLNVINILLGWPLDRIPIAGKPQTEAWSTILPMIDTYDIPKPIILDKKVSKNIIKTPEEILDPPPKDNNLIVLEHLVPDPELYIYEKICVSREILCSEVRESHLFKKANPFDYPQWKSFRWIYWALETKNYYPPDYYRFLKFILPKMKIVFYRRYFEEEFAEMYKAKEDLAAKPPTILESTGKPKASGSGLCKKPSQKDIKSNQPATGTNEDSKILGSTCKAKPSGSGLCKKPSQKDIKSNQQAAGANDDGNKEDENNMWLDFNKMVEIIRNFNYFPRLKIFKQIYLVTDELLEKSDKSKSESGKGKNKKETIYPEMFEIVKTEDQIIYIFSDSDQKNKCIWELMGIQCLDACKFIPNLFILNKFDWVSIKKQLEILKMSSKSEFRNFYFPKGRKLYSLNINAFKFGIRLFTKEPVKTGSMLEMLDYMNSESYLFVEYFENFKNCFYNVVTTFNTTDFVFRKIEFYDSILYTCCEGYKKTKVFRRYIYEKFLELIIEYLQLNDVEEAKLFKRLFLMVNFKVHLANIKMLSIDVLKKYNKIKNKICMCQPYEYENPREFNINDCKSAIKSCGKEFCNFCNCPTKQNPIYSDEDLELIRNTAAIIIQAYFKSYYVRLLQLKHNEKKFKEFQLLLSKFFKKYFVTDDYLVYNFLRKLFFIDFKDFKQNHLLQIPIDNETLIGDFYALFNDFDNILYVKKYSMEINSEKNYIPLKVANFFSESSEMTKYIILLDVKLTEGAQFFFRIFNNDTCEEIFKKNDLMWCFKQNHFGYKIIIYAISELLIDNISFNLVIGQRRHLPQIKFFDVEEYSQSPFFTWIQCDNLNEFALYKELSTISSDAYYENIENNTENQLCKFNLILSKKSFIILFYNFQQLNFKYKMEFTFCLVDELTWVIDTRKTFKNEFVFWKYLNEGNYVITISYTKEIEKKSYKKKFQTDEETIDKEDIGEYNLVICSEIKSKIILKRYSTSEEASLEEEAIE